MLLLSMVYERLLSEPNSTEGKWISVFPYRFACHNLDDVGGEMGGLSHNLRIYVQNTCIC